jgi:hypothetical protein
VRVKAPSALASRHFRGTQPIAARAGASTVGTARNRDVLYASRGVGVGTCNAKSGEVPTLQQIVICGTVRMSWLEWGVA